MENQGKQDRQAAGVVDPTVSDTVANQQVMGKVDNSPQIPNKGVVLGWGD